MNHNAPAGSRTKFLAVIAAVVGTIMFVVEAVMIYFVLDNLKNSINDLYVDDF